MIDALFDIIDDTAAAPVSAIPALEVYDRSTLERYADCPSQGAYVDAGKVDTSSPEAESGNEVHRILSAAVKARSEDGMRASGLRDLIEQMAAASRPDLQPDVVEAAKRVYPIVQLICAHQQTGEDRHPDDLLRYDGGELLISDGGDHPGLSADEAGWLERAARVDHRGQLSADLVVDNMPARLTCEVDLLMATASDVALDMTDWKSGRAHWTATDVRSSFQFQFYSYVVLCVYNTVQTVNVSVFMPREGFATDPVAFRRKDMFVIEQRIKSAVRLLRKYRGADPDTVPTCAAPEKCNTCPAVRLCHRRHSGAIDDPREALEQLIIAEAFADDVRAKLSTMVREQGKDFIFDALAFGQCAPVERAPRAKACKVYKPENAASGGVGYNEPPPHVPVAGAAPSDQASVLRMLAACQGKHKHASRPDAEAERLKAIAGGEKGMNSYKCSHCGFWHVGHAPGSKRGRKPKLKPDPTEDPDPVPGMDEMGRALGINPKE